MKVASVTNSIQNGLKNLGNRIMESRWGNIAMPENPTDIAKTLALYSTTTKDAVNCYYYTTQSYNNKKIPEDNRKFVAGIDLANGILNVITQLTLGLFVNKHSGEWFDKMFKGGFKIDSKNSQKVLAEVNKVLESIKVSANEEGLKKALKGLNKGMKGGFSVIAVLVVTQIIAKRMIVPFLSTPLAGYFKKILESREEKIKHKNEDNLDINKTNDNINKNTPDSTSSQVGAEDDSSVALNNAGDDSFTNLVHKPVKYAK